MVVKKSIDQTKKRKNVIKKTQKVDNSKKVIQPLKVNKKNETSKPLATNKVAVSSKVATGKSNSQEPEIQKKQITKPDKTFLAFLFLLLIAGFLVGGLLASFSIYRSMVPDTSSTEVKIIPATGLVNESDILSPTPTPVAPGIDSERSTSVPDVTSSDSPRSEVAEPRQPVGTTEFNDGNYKVYQYPDGNVIVVW